VKVSLVVINEQVKSRALDAVRSLSFDEPHTVKIEPVEKNRSIAQHRLKWLWVSDIADFGGETKEEANRRLKKRFLVPIFERDDAEYAAMIETVREVHRQGMKEQAVKLFDRIVDMTRSSDASVKQMAEFLTDIEQDCGAVQIPLRRPEDLYREAMR